MTSLGTVKCSRLMTVGWQILFSTWHVPLCLPRIAGLGMKLFRMAQVSTLQLQAQKLIISPQSLRTS